MGVSVHQCSVKKKWMAGVNQLSMLMLCILEVYCLPPSYFEKCGGLSSHTVIYQWLNCPDWAVSAAWSKGWTMPPKTVLRSHLMYSAGRDCQGAVSWPHVSKLCPSNYTMTKKAPAWLLNKRNPKSPTGSTLWQHSLFPRAGLSFKTHIPTYTPRLHSR